MKDLKLKKIFKNFLAVETKVADGAPRTLVVKISSPTPDRSKDTVQPDGMDATNFLKNPVVLYAHNYSDLPIAKCTGLKTTDNGVLATVEFPEAGTYAKADVVYQMYKQGFLNAWSIGFMPTDYDENDAGGYNFKKWELFEFSSVPVPDNPEALTVMRSKGINVDLLVEEKKEEVKDIDDPKLEEKEIIDPENEKKSQKEEVKEVKDAADGEDDETEPYTDDTKVTDLTVGDLKDILEDTLENGDDDDTGKSVNEAVVKDVSQIVALGYLLDELKYFIQAFTQMGVKQESLDKMTQALALIMDVVKEQAIIGEKSITLPATMKSGRTISAKHEEMLKAACDHMGKGAEAVQTVLDSVAEQQDESKDDDKHTEQPLTKRLLSQIGVSQKQFKEADKQIGLTLRLMKIIQSEQKSEGGE